MEGWGGQGALDFQSCDLRAHQSRTGTGLPRKLWHGARPLHRAPPPIVLCLPCFTTEGMRQPCVEPACG